MVDDISAPVPLFTELVIEVAQSLIALVAKTDELKTEGAIACAQICGLSSILSKIDDGVIEHVVVCLLPKAIRKHQEGGCRLAFGSPIFSDPEEDFQHIGLRVFVVYVIRRRVQQSLPQSLPSAVPDKSFKIVCISVDRKVNINTVSI
jgi:hypothetical protein